MGAREIIFWIKGFESLDEICEACGKLGEGNMLLRGEETYIVCPKPWSHKSYVLHEGRMHLSNLSVYIEFELANLPCTVQTQAFSLETHKGILDIDGRSQKQAHVCWCYIRWRKGCCTPGNGICVRSLIVINRKPSASKLKLWKLLKDEAHKISQKSKMLDKLFQEIKAFVWPDKCPM